MLLKYPPRVGKHFPLNSFNHLPTTAAPTQAQYPNVRVLFAPAAAPTQAQYPTVRVLFAPASASTQAQYPTVRVLFAPAAAQIGRASCRERV